MTSGWNSEQAMWRDRESVVIREDPDEFFLIKMPSSYRHHVAKIPLIRIRFFGLLSKIKPTNFPMEKCLIQWF